MRTKTLFLILLVGFLFLTTGCGRLRERIEERRDDTTAPSVDTAPNTTESVKSTPEATVETEASRPTTQEDSDDTAMGTAMVETDTTVAEELAETDTTYTPPTDGSLVVNKAIVYKAIEGVDPNLTSLDIYAPPNAANAPVMVFIHGGGWQIGDKSNTSAVENKAPFFTSNGWMFVSINYRLSPTVQHPAHVEDVAAALAWVHTHIADYGGTPDTLYIMGHSAGAHLAALVATDERYLQAAGADLNILDGVVLLDGAGYDVARQAQSAGNRAAEMYTNAFSTDPTIWADASPDNHVASDKGIPPFLIIYVVRRAPSRLQSERLGELLTDAGVAAKVMGAEGKTHATLNRELGLEGDEPTQWVWGFIQ